MHLVRGSCGGIEWFMKLYAYLLKQLEGKTNVMLLHTFPVLRTSKIQRCLVFQATICCKTWKNSSERSLLHENLMIELKYLFVNIDKWIRISGNMLISTIISLLVIFVLWSIDIISCTACQHSKNIMGCPWWLNALWTSFSVSNKHGGLFIWMRCVRMW